MGTNRNDNQKKKGQTIKRHDSKKKLQHRYFNLQPISGDMRLMLVPVPRPTPKPIKDRNKGTVSMCVRFT